MPPSPHDKMTLPRANTLPSSPQARIDLDLLADAHTIAQQPKHISSFLVKHALDPDETLWAWQQGYGQPLLPDYTPDPEDMSTKEYLITSIARILQLENTHQGGAEQLYRLNRIRNLGRASSASVLRHMLDDRMRSASRIIALTAAQSDTSGGAMRSVFADYEHLMVNRPDDTAVVVIEMADVSDYRYAEARVTDHGKDSKAHVIVHNAHGPDKVDHRGAYLELGLRRGSYSRTYDKLGKPEIDAVLVPVTAAISIPQTSIITAACWAGEGDDSIAEYICEQTGLDTYAPIEEVAVDRLSISDQEGILVPKLPFNGVYAAGNKWRTRSSYTRHFRPD